jgi:hypothetical protein
MKIEKWFKGWKEYASLTFVFKRIEIDISYHPSLWATPHFSIQHIRKSNTSIDSTCLCFSFAICYTYDSFYDNVREKPEWLSDNWS